MNQLTVKLFGSPQVAINEAAVVVSWRKALALVAFLAVTGQPQSRETLATLFWPELDQKKSRAALRKALFVLNQAIGSEWFATAQDTIGLSSAAKIAVDVIQFKSLIGQAAAHQHEHATLCTTCMTWLETAAALVTDRFLAGFTLADSLEFDNWQQGQAEQLHTQFIAILRRLVIGCQAKGELDKAVAVAQRWVAQDPLEEEAHFWLIQLHRQTGQLQSATAQYEACCQILADELGISPSAKMQLLSQRLRQGAPIHPHLPQPMTEFIGREPELYYLNQLLAQPQPRLITITGLGGIGKTRLSLAAAEAQSSLFADGVCFVPLAALDDPSLLIPTIATALGVSFEGKSPRQVLFRALREKQLLLILDNFEQLIDGALDIVQELITAGPGVKLLVTSRHQLNVYGETIINLAGLPIPAPTHPNQPPETYGSVKLFLSCARRAQFGFELKPHEQGAVIRLCELVEGSPLGIELAAAWLQILSCAEIAAKLEHDLTFLTATTQGMAERHRSLQAVIAHSWKLLPAEEQKILKMLSIFRGGFSHEAATKVAAVSLSSLSSLIHKSLVRRAGNGRYELHEIVRQFAAEQRASDPSFDQLVQTRHCSYYASLLHRYQFRLLGSEQRQLLRLLESEMANVRQAWRFAVDHQLLDKIVQMHVALFLVHEGRSWFLQGEELFAYGRQQLTATHSHPAAAQILGVLHHFQGVFCQRRGLYDQARELLTAGLALLRQSGGPAYFSLPTCLYDLGIVAYAQGNYQEAAMYFEETLTIFKQHASQPGSHWMMAHVLNSLGSVAVALGDYEHAKTVGQDCLEQRQALKDQRGIALSLNFLGSLAYRTGRYTRARQYCEQSLVLSREIDSRRGMAKALSTLGQIAQDENDLPTAQEQFERSLSLFREIGDQRRVAYTLGNLSQIMLQQGQTYAALEALGEAISLSSELQALPATLKVMVDAAYLLSRMEHGRLAYTLLACVRAHSASEALTKQKAERLLASCVLPKSPPSTTPSIKRILEEIKQTLGQLQSSHQAVS